MRTPAAWRLLETAGDAVGPAAADAIAADAIAAGAVMVGVGMVGVGTDDAAADDAAANGLAEDGAAKDGATEDDTAANGPAEDGAAKDGAIGGGAIGGGAVTAGWPSPSDGDEPAVIDDGGVATWPASSAPAAGTALARCVAAGMAMAAVDRSGVDGVADGSVVRADGTVSAVPVAEGATVEPAAAAALAVDVVVCAATGRAAADA